MPLLPLSTRSHLPIHPNSTGYSSNPGLQKMFTEIEGMCECSPPHCHGFKVICKDDKEERGLRKSLCLQVSRYTVSFQSSPGYLCVCVYTCVHTHTHTHTRCSPGPVPTAATLLQDLSLPITGKASIAHTWLPGGQMPILWLLMSK